jgi:hypothetical protein
MIPTEPIIPRGIRIGDKTHHQDHAIYPLSFKPMKRIVSNARILPAVYVIAVLLFRKFFKIG